MATLVPSDVNTLETAGASAHRQAAICFEPSAIVPFQHAWSWQRQWQLRLLDNPNAMQAVWLLQHHTCYTLGRGADERFLHFDANDPPAPLHRIDRGGEVTCHLPGQLVVYPVLDLRRFQPDLHWYLRRLEQVLIKVLADLGLKGERVSGFTGLWLEGFKVASIGVGCRRWVTQHGLALNVNCDLAGFEDVVPCGLTGTSVGRLSEWIPGLTVAQVQPLLRHALAETFDLTWQYDDDQVNQFASDLLG